MVKVAEGFMPFKKDSKGKELPSDEFIEFKEHFRIVNNAIDRSLKLEAELEKKNKIIDELMKINEKPITFGREELKAEVINKIIEVYPEATADFKFGILDEIKDDLVKSSTRNFLIINRK